ncbi:MAG: Lrp/AsnC family transcriptional regulator [Candidatus Thorarchaeota archaeon]
MTANTLAIDSKDMLILEYIRENGRGSYQEIAENVNLSATSVFERIKKLKEKNIIITDTAPVIDCTQLPEVKNMIILLEASPGADVRAMGNEIIDIKGVKTLYRLCGDYDYYIHICCVTPPELEDSIRKVGAIPGVSNLKKELIDEFLKESYHTFCRTTLNHNENEE